MDAFFFYLLCFGLGFTFTLISAVMGHFFDAHTGDAGGDIGTGGHAGAGFDQAGMPGISIFSPTVIAAFITAFGAFGMIFSKIPLTEQLWISAPLALLSGLLIAAGVFVMFNKLFSKTQASSEGHVADLVGATATVITPIPQNGVGEIAYVQGGSRYSAPARSESGAAIANGMPVTIFRIVGTQFYVVPI